jgi:hypothetical protein
MTEEEAAVIEAAYGVDHVFFPTEPDRSPSEFLAKLDLMHMAILRLDKKRKTEVVVAEAAVIAEAEAIYG